MTHPSPLAPGRVCGVRHRAATSAVGLACLLATANTWGQTFPTTSPMPYTPSYGIPSQCTEGAPKDLEIPVSGITQPLTAISVSMDLWITWAGLPSVELIAPGGAPSAPLFGRIGSHGGGDYGYSSKFNGTYQFVDPSVSATNLWTVTAPLGISGTIPPGAYAAAYMGGPGMSLNPAPAVPLRALFAGLAPAQVNGTWTLRVRNYSCVTGVTRVNAASLTLAADPEAPVAAPQNITFPPQTSPRTVAPGGTFAISPLASATSNLPVTYGSSTPAVCTVGGTTVTVVAPGACTLTADQPGSADWLPASQVTQTVTVGAAPPPPPDSSVTAVPTLGQWALMFLSAVLAALALVGLRRARTH